MKASFVPTWAVVAGIGIAVGLASSRMHGAAPGLDEGRGVDLPAGDPLLEAIQERLGRPDRVTGSGRMFLHYDLGNGDTLSLVVSGRKVIGVEHMPKP